MGARDSPSNAAGRLGRIVPFHWQLALQHDGRLSVEQRQSKASQETLQGKKDRQNRRRVPSTYSFYSLAHVLFAADPSGAFRAPRRDNSGSQAAARAMENVYSLSCSWKDRVCSLLYQPTTATRNKMKRSRDIHIDSLWELSEFR